MWPKKSRFRVILVYKLNNVQFPFGYMVIIQNMPPARLRPKNKFN